MMDESEMAQKIVTATVETMELAEQVLIERQKRDGKEFSNEKPSILEVVTVSNLIVNMSMAGMYKEKKADDWIPSPAAFDAFIKRIEPIVDSKVSVAVARAQLMAVKARIVATQIPRPPSAVPPLVDPEKGAKSEGGIGVSGWE